MGIVDDLENAIDIVDLVGKYAKLKKAGVNYKALCPFPGHSEKTPSFVVSPSKQIAYCFGCHKGGGALKFVMDMENCEFKEAIEILGNYTGIQVHTNINTEEFQKKKSLYGLYKDATNYYKQALGRYPEIKKYLLDRGINNESIENFHMGYADSGVNLYNYLKEKGYNDELITASNIFVDVRAKKDKFIGRIMFPIQNARGDFVAFTARITGKGEPKYLNSPASKFYDKSAILYGLYTAKSHITKQDFVIVTEGNADTIALQQHGFFNSVAVSGTAMTEKHITMLKRLTKKIYLCFDNDKAGVNATKLSLETMKNKDLEVKIIVLKGGKDPDEILAKGGDFQSLIDSALTPVGYFIEKSKYDLGSLDEKKKLLIVLLETVKAYSDNVEKDFYLKEIAHKLDINEHIIYDEFNKVRFKKEIKEKSEKGAAYTSEELAIGFILYEPESKSIFESEIAFIDDVSNDLAGVLKSGKKYIEKLELQKKGRLKGAALMVEQEIHSSTEETNNGREGKLAKKINHDIFKRLSSELKIQMNAGDNDALKKYSLLIQVAKKRGIK